MWDSLKGIWRKTWNWVWPGAGDFVWGVSESDFSGAYGGYVNSPEPKPKTWFQKLLQTVVTIVLIVVGLVVLLIVFKGYKFLDKFLKLKK